MELDISKLRACLEDYYGTAVFSGLPMAVTELAQVQNASPQELVDMAQRAGIDLELCEK